MVEIYEEIPSPEEYLKLREIVGMTPRTLEGAKIGLKNSFYSVTIRNNEGELIGMGRVVGDGGTVFQIVDMGVHPKYQGQGLGKKIMGKIHKYIKKLDDKSYINLLASEKGYGLYEKYDFVDSSPYKGMKFNRDK